MKKTLFILFCAFVSFAFTNEKTEPISADKNAEITPSMEIKTFPYENGTITIVIMDQGICEQGTSTGQLSTDCDGDGIPEYVWRGTVCVEHIDALIAYFNSTC